VNRRFAYLVLGALVLGILVGFALHALVTDPAQQTTVASYLSIVTEIFLRLIKMIIAPLIFTTLVSGIAHMSDASAVGRIGAKTLIWFLGASVVSLAVGLVLVQVLQPGVGLDLHAATESVTAGGGAGTLSLRDFVTHLVPTSFFEAMAQNEILQIVVFSVLVGTAMVALGKRTAALLELIEQIAAIMLKITGYVIACAPVAVFAAIAATVATQGTRVLLVYAQFIAGFYLALLVLWAMLIGAAALAIGRRSVALMRAIREPALLALSTSSSAAAYPLLLERLGAFGVPLRIVSFVLPLGYSFNLDGSMMYCTFAVLFIAQAYGIHLSIAQQATMFLILLVTSKGLAGVPRAAFVVIASTLTYFKLPEAGLLLVLAVDHLLDMGRSAANVIGNSVAAVIVARWEGSPLAAGNPASPIQL
jgi:Na+/H+-dicarboxylate symporter